MKTRKRIIVCNFVVWVLAVIYSFVPYTQGTGDSDERHFEVLCSGAWDKRVQLMGLCATQGRLAQIAFWAGLASALVTVSIIVLENYRKQTTS